MKIESLKKRSEFVRLNGSKNRVSAKSLVLQVSHNDTESKDTVRLGFTATKKLGNAAIRNRIKRRLRAAARIALPSLSTASYDYVIIGRNSALDRDFGDIVKDLKYALHTANNTISNS